MKTNIRFCKEHPKIILMPVIDKNGEVALICSLCDIENLPKKEVKIKDKFTKSCAYCGKDIEVDKWTYEMECLIRHVHCENNKIIYDKETDTYRCKSKFKIK